MSSENQPEPHDNQPGSPIPGEPEFLVVGRLGKPHGIYGEIVMDVYTDFPERLEPGVTLWVGPQHKQVKIGKRRPHSRGMLLFLEGYETREEVAELRNQLVYVRSADRPQLAFYLIAPILILGFISHSLLIPKFGSMGAAAVSTGLAWIGAIVFIGSLYRIWGIRLSPATIIRSVIICICIYGLSTQWVAPGFMVLAKMALMSMLIPIAMLLSGELKNDDISFLRSIVNFRIMRNRS